MPASKIKGKDGSALELVPIKMEFAEDARKVVGLIGKLDRGGFMEDQRVGHAGGNGAGSDPNS